MRIALTIALVGSLVGSWLPAHEALANGVTYVGETVDGQREGLWETYSSSGAMISQGYFSNGLRHGRWTTYDSEGLPTAIGNYVEGMQEGIWSLFENGILKGRGNYRADNRHGVWESFD